MKKIFALSVISLALCALSCGKEETPPPFTNPIPPEVPVVTEDSSKHPLKGIWTCYQYSSVKGTKADILTCNWKVSFGDTLVQDTLFQIDKDYSGTYDYAHKLVYHRDGAVSIYYLPGISVRHKVKEVKVSKHYEYVIEGDNDLDKKIYRLKK